MNIDANRLERLLVYCII